MTLSVREAFIAALARRVDDHQGAARALLEARLAALRAESVSQPAMSSRPGGQAGTRGPLGQLADGIAARHAANEPPVTQAAGLTSASPAQRELGTLRQFRGAWSRLFAEQRLRQTLAQVPPQAGPLNSHHLVHRALAVMQDISPAYLQRFVTQVEALLWLEQQQTSVGGVPQRLDKKRKSGR
ncbi:DUF2894 domain-containing protein [Ottowia thiooxydans]|uniref:DUF2894 domain-containing protein n=1 Tax=Ottowia thiooxydans TaxID=219182 RepID=UPI0004130358|nr:DUF2894 domain-containing protein [Ottowia thiooxydans]